MDFVRSLLLMLCISVISMSSSLASDGHGVNSNGIPSKVANSFKTLATGSAYFGGPPYTFANAVENGYPIQFNNPTQAVTEGMLAEFRQSGDPVFLCSYTINYQTPSNTNSWIAATVIGTGTYIFDGNTESCYGSLNVAIQPLAVLSSVYLYDARKSLGPGCGCDGSEDSSGNDSATGEKGSVDPSPPGTGMVGDPINTGTGNKYVEQSDYAGSRWLTFRRFYNSHVAVASTAMGAHWRHSFDRSLVIGNSPASMIILMRPNGVQETFNISNGQWVSDPDVSDVLTENDNAQGVAISYTAFIAETRRFETYDTSGLLQTVTDASGQGITLTYSNSSTPSNVAPNGGLLLTVTDPEGRQLNFTYNGNGNVSYITMPDGRTLTYAYDTSGNLLSVQYPDNTTRQYVYNESSLTSSTSLPNAMTGIVDEAGVRYENTTFDPKNRAVASSLANGVDSVQISYNDTTYGNDGITFALGLLNGIGFTQIYGVLKPNVVSKQCGTQCNQPWFLRSYDANGYPASYTDFNRNVTATTYNSAGLQTQQIDAQGLATQRTTNTTWNTTLRVPLTKVVLDANGTTVAQTGWVYNATGQMLARCEIDPVLAASYTCATTGVVPAGVRRWTYTYCTAVDTVQCPLIGLLLSVTGPRTDLTQTSTYSYYLTSSSTGCGTPGAACHHAGDLYQTTDAMGHVTSVASYDADGRVTRIIDANGVNTDLTYTPRGWLASRSVGGATTSFTYTSYGAIHSVTDPDSITTTYGYDTAHRLIKISDALGNYVQYTLDATGDKTAEQVYDSSGILHKSLARTFNSQGQLTSVVDGLNNTVFNATASTSYDANGNLIQSGDALGIQRQLSYDALNRLVQTIANYNGTNAATQNTTIDATYDSLDHVIQVSDPSSLVTSYQYDGLSNTSSQTSPDTGSTTRTFDAAGDVLTSTDAKSITATNTYDALNRLTSVSYADTMQNITYTYDEANSVTGCSSSSPVGRLTRIVEASVTTVYCYDARGNITRKQQITGTGTDTTAYTYTAGNRLGGITYPSGSQASYAFDADGRIQTVTLTPVGGSAGTAVSSVSYLPFGPVASYALGNGQVITRTFDANYRLTDLTSPAFNLHVARDAIGDITALGNAPGANPATETYAYDSLYRLTGVTDASTSLESFIYNRTGDRLSKTGSGLAIGTYGYNTNTHQLIATGNAARSVDADGNTTAITQAGSTYGFGYSARNRLTVAQVNSTTMGSYAYNALGQRISKSAAATERFVYNEGSQLLSEYGTKNRDYVWMGDIPVALVDETISGSTTTSSVTYVTADGLGTPRAVANAAGTMLWQWAYAGNPFGEQQPTSSSGYTLNLRYPGQYYDAESGTNYNLFRNYEAATGRYLQSDPIGLNGGISTYAYAGGNSLYHRDPTGKFIPEAIGGAVIGGAWGLASGYFGGDTGGQLWTDAFEGAAVGGLAGLTDGASLLEGASGYLLRGGIAAAGEAGRQELNYGCVKSWGGVALAGGLSGLGDLGQDAAVEVSGGAGGELSSAASAVSSAAGGTVSGVAQTAISQQQNFQDQQEAGN